MSSQNRRFPAEWENQQGILLCFPHSGKDWPGKYEAIKWDFIEFIKKISCFEQVFLIIANKKQQDVVSGMLLTAHVNLKKVAFITHKTNRSWMRDSGPIIIKNGAKLEALNSILMAGLSIPILSSTEMFRLEFQSFLACL